MEKQEVKTSAGSITLPIEYRNTEAVMCAFPARANAVRQILPPPLKPVLLTPSTAVCGIVVFRYTDTTIGPYNELGVVFPVLFKPIINLPLLPAVFEKYYKNLGYYIWHLPVTTEIAYAGGLEIWGYPKFVAEITFEWNENGFESKLSREGHHILTLSVSPEARRARLAEERQNLVTYSIKDDHLLKTTIPATSQIRRYRKRGAGTLELGEDGVSKDLQKVLKSLRSLEVRIFEKMDSYLPLWSERTPLRK